MPLARSGSIAAPCKARKALRSAPGVRSGALHSARGYDPYATQLDALVLWEQVGSQWGSTCWIRAFPEGSAAGLFSFNKMVASMMLVGRAV
jgi:hypothetical protein